MFIAIQSNHSNQSDNRSPKTIMNMGLGNGLLATVIAAIVLLAALSGWGTRSLSALNYDLEHAGFSTSTVTSAPVLPNGWPSATPRSTFEAAAQGSSRSEIMDSYESVPSLAALAKQGNTGTHPAQAVERSR